MRRLEKLLKESKFIASRSSFKKQNRKEEIRKVPKKLKKKKNKSRIV